MTVLVGIALGMPAAAGTPLITIDAVVHDDLQIITGRLRVAGGDDLRWVDPLTRLPEPTDDRTAQRTFPGLPEQGVVRFTSVGPDEWAFTTLLPRRFGDLGVMPGRSLLANGGWYPQPLADGVPVDALWTVRIALPAGAVGAVGDAAGRGAIAWSGHGERASLAVLSRGHLTPVERDGVQLTFVTRRKPRKVLRERAHDLLVQARPPEDTLRAAVVQGPLRRRLVRPGLGLAYTSDRLWRLTPGLRRYHDIAATRGLLQASLDVPDPLLRELAAAALTRHQARSMASARGLLGRFAWNPVVDAILADRTLPFWGDVFDAALPQDPLQDDLMEMWRPHGAATALIAQLEDLHGPVPTFSLAAALVRGETLLDAAAEAEVDEDVVRDWVEPPRDQDLVLQVDRRAPRISVLRVPRRSDAPAEVAVVRVDGQTEVHRFAPGEDLWTFEPDASPRRVVLDPDRHVAQTSRVGDAWPPRFRVTWAAWLSGFNPTAGWVDAYGSVWARERDDTRNVYSAAIAVGQQDLPALTLGWSHRRGPLQDGLNRPHRFSVWAEPAWSNPRFATGDTSVFTVGGGVAYAWDTRISSLFPLKGRRLALSVGGGVAPVEGTRWGSVRASTAGIVSPHPRWAFAGTAGIGAAVGDTDQRLLWLGGPGTVSGLKPGEAVGRLRASSRAEVRWAPVRHASVPLLGLAWLSGVQVTAGAEAAWVRTVDDTDAAAVGLVGSVGVVTDLLGASPTLTGVSVGVPAWTQGVETKAWGGWQPTLWFGQAF